MSIIIFKLLMALEFVVCALLIGIVLIQRSKGQGVGLSFGGGAEAIFGAQMGNVLTRFTVMLGIVFLVNTTVLAVLRPSGTVVSNSIVERNAPRATENARPQAPAVAVEDEDLYGVLESAMPESPVVVTMEKTGGEEPAADPAVREPEEEPATPSTAGEPEEDGEN